MCALLRTPAATGSRQRCPTSVASCAGAFEDVCFLLSSHMGTATRCLYTVSKSPSPFHTTSMRQSGSDILQSPFTDSFKTDIDISEKQKPSHPFSQGNKIPQHFPRSVRDLASNPFLHCRGGEEIFSIRNQKPHYFLIESNGLMVSRTFLETQVTSFQFLTEVKLLFPTLCNSTLMSG